MCDGLCRNGAIGPDLVLYVKRFPKYFTESLSENARDGVGAPACSIRHDDLDRGFWPLPRISMCHCLACQRRTGAVISKKAALGARNSFGR
jgi:hypothetical protein